MKWPIKKNHDKFLSLEEFKDNLNRGGEIEFEYKEEKYSITHYKDKLCFIKLGETKDNEFESIDALLDHKVKGSPLREIIAEIDPYYRLF